MTREKIEALVRDIYSITGCNWVLALSLSSLLEAALVAAENDALERAANDICNAAWTPPSEWALAKAYAARIRSLKSQSKPSGSGAP